MASLKEAVYDDKRQDAVNVLSKPLPKLYVEGGSDESILLHFFSGVARVVIPRKSKFQGKKGGGKTRVIDKVNEDLNSFGFVDMDHDFKSSKVSSNKRVLDSSPEACLISHLLNKEKAMSYIKRMLDYYAVYENRDVERIYEIAVLHSIIVWTKGRLGDHFEGGSVSLSENFWEDIFDIKTQLKPLKVLDEVTITGKEHVKRFYSANKQAIDTARYRDHSLAKTLSRFIDKHQKSQVSLKDVYFEKGLRRLAKKQPRSEKLESFSKEIQNKFRTL